MSIYFAFSDENGAYKRIRGRRFTRAHPWYIRSTIYFPGEEWKLLQEEFRSLKEFYELPVETEIKWSYAWSLKSHERSRKAIPEKAGYYFLREYDPDRLQNFLRDAVALLKNRSDCRIVVTATDNVNCQRIRVERLLRMHLQESMQRIEMDMQDRGNALCVLFIDPVSEEKDKALREAYAELYRQGDLVGRYGNIKDSLNLEHSHHSVGVQLADYVAGAMGSILQGRTLGATIYRESLAKLIRRCPSGTPAGYGVREVPADRGLRTRILQGLGE